MKRLFLILAIVSGMGLVACENDATAEATAEDTAQEDAAQEDSQNEDGGESAAVIEVE